MHNTGSSLNLYLTSDAEANHDFQFSFSRRTMLPAMRRRRHMTQREEAEHHLPWRDVIGVNLKMMIG